MSDVCLFYQGSQISKQPFLNVSTYIHTVFTVCTKYKIYKIPHGPSSPHNLQPIITYLLTHLSNSNPQHFLIGSQCKPLIGPRWPYQAALIGHDKRLEQRCGKGMIRPFFVNGLGLIGVYQHVGYFACFAWFVYFVPVYVVYGVVSMGYY